MLEMINVILNDLNVLFCPQGAVHPQTPPISWPLASLTNRIHQKIASQLFIDLGIYYQLDGQSDETPE